MTEKKSVLGKRERGAQSETERRGVGGRVLNSLATS